MGDFNIGLMIIVMIENKMWWKNRDGKVLVKVGDLVWVCGWEMGGECLCNLEKKRFMKKVRSVMKYLRDCIIDLILKYQMESRMW